MAGQSRSDVPALTPGRGALVVLTVAVALRLGLSWVNPDANDDHVPVIQIMAEERRMPQPSVKIRVGESVKVFQGEAWQAYQPPLYHALAAGVVTAVDARTPEEIRRVANLLACAAATVTLILLLSLARSGARSPESATATFAIVAMLPGFVGISVQATNDSLVILCGVAVTLFGVRHARTGRLRPVAMASACLFLAGMTKANGLLLVVPLAVLIAASAALKGRDLRLTLASLGLVATAMLGAWYLGPYARYARDFGSPFVTNWAPSVRPALIRESYVERPGLTSIVHGIGTFRLVDLIRNPQTNVSAAGYPRHRTSYWSQIYGRANFLFFHQYPETWVTHHPVVTAVGRLSFVLGLLPAALLMYGLAILVRDALARRASPEHTEVRFLAAMALTYLGFGVAYAVRLRDFSSMKDIFIYPALGALAVAVARGWDDGLGRNRHARIAGGVIVGCLAGLSLVSGLFLLWKLARG